MRITRVKPRSQTKNYFARYRVETATFDPSGENPIAGECLVVGVSETDQAAKIAPEACGSISDL